MALVLAGGIALGAYEAGAYAALSRTGNLHPTWIAASSIGSVNAALIAGGPADTAVERLTRFWNDVSTDPYIGMAPFGMPTLQGFWRRVYNRTSVFQTLVFGKPGIFRPRLAPGIRSGASDVSALYDLQPLREKLASLVDFERVNDGPVRLSLATTDVTTGTRVVFDSRRGTRLTADHVLASCALLPVYAPIEIEGRLLGDGALSSNTPLDLVLDEEDADGSLCFVVDLFSVEGHRPHDLTDVLSRAGDLTFGNQTLRILDGRVREYRLRDLVGRLAERLPAGLRDEPDIAAILAEAGPRRATVLHLSFRANLDEAGAMKGFDFSRQSIADRWHSGERDLAEAIRVLAATPEPGSGLVVHSVRSPDKSRPA